MKIILIKKRYQSYSLPLSINSFDVEDSIKSTIPGEWVIFANDNAKYIGFVNQFSEHQSKGYILKLINHNQDKEIHENGNEVDIAKSLIKKFFFRAVEKRKKLNYFNDGLRLIYGTADLLPGLIVDIYENVSVVKITNAAMDRFRGVISQSVQEVFPNKKVFFLDLEKERKLESLPNYPQEKFESLINIYENDVRYQVSTELMQKAGYYYDHRDNRRKLAEYLSRHNAKIETALDLFSYCGSWGLNVLKSVEGAKVIFVDQAAMGDVIRNNLRQNGVLERGEFVRGDVFSFLDDQLKLDRKFDLIIADPPAFSKREENVKAALNGYFKLYKNIVSLLANNSYLAVASCTYGITHEDLDKIVNDALSVHNKNYSLVDCGIQGNDHPIKSLRSKESYIKYLLYHIHE